MMSDSKVSMDLTSKPPRVEGGSREQEQDRLEQLGYTQELRREFSLWSMAALCMCLMATWEALSAVLSSAIVSGGAPCLFYN